MNPELPFSRTRHLADADFHKLPSDETLNQNRCQVGQVGNIQNMF